MRTFFLLGLAFFVTCTLSGQSQLRLKNPHVHGPAPDGSADVSSRLSQTDQRRPDIPSVSDSSSMTPGHTAPTQDLHQYLTGGLHYLIETSSSTPDDLLDQLAALQIPLIRPVPDTAYIVVATNLDDLWNLNLTSISRFASADKISAELDPTADPGVYLVEYHPDVADGDARGLLTQIGLTVLENPDLLAGHYLVQGSYSDMWSLASWDEVAYIFPASNDLIQGQPAHPCIGALTTNGTIGQYIATVGDGWDGPGQGSAQLTYTFSTLTSKIPRDQLIAQVQNALAEWASVANITFTPGTANDASRNLNFLFGSRAHGDPYPFDGPGGVLAHTFYPNPPNPEPIAGDLHFDDDENWQVGADIDLYSVVLHELGHALGLGHADKPGAVMYPYYARAVHLTQDDKNAILGLYAAAAPAHPASPTGSNTPSTPPAPTPTPVPSTPAAVVITVQAPATTSQPSLAITGSVTGIAGAFRISWTTDRGQAGDAIGSSLWRIAALPLSSGVNNLTIQTTDSLNHQTLKTIQIARVAAPTPVSITITRPITLASSQASAVLTGMASHASGIARVTWTNLRGGSGAASGTSSWTATVPLQPGINEIHFVGVATDGTQGLAVILVKYIPAAAPSSPTATGTNNPSQPDTTPPTLTISSPRGTILSTSAQTVTISGTAQDNVGVTQVSWSVSTGSSGTAAGTANWSTGSINLLVGDNFVTIRARDAAGNVGWRSVLITRR